MAKHTRVFFKKLTKKAPPGRNEEPQPAESDGLHDTIAVRAYALYEARGHRHGWDLQDWLDAEREILSQRHSA